ncbi:tripartite tricarboxylate transporter substrate binding protein [Lampropedia puyangensis]|uniref:Tripartite tricarboxylate transporter substrate binding protein n=1 Tax=Lampropedia puyangensis TaxID=1330072 RepID=A0A4S8EVM6_9BURK|nr:tripartite tricarboxylate transporter substrate binding protein [Lampropedia puyangensis]
MVGFAAGGLTDGLPRLLSQPLGEILGQSVVVENRAGAAGSIATAHVAGAKPDGYTLLASGVGNIVVLPHTTTMSINPVTDLEHITMTGEGDQIVSIHPAVPAKTFQEFVALSKEKPGTLFYGSAGVGGNMHLYLEYLRSLSGADIDAVQYKGGSDLMPDFLANRVQMSLNAPPVVEGYIKDGKLRPVLIFGRERNPKMPDVPTVRELGMPELEAASNWFGLHAPKGTPEPIIRKINAAVVEALQRPEVQEGLRTMSVRAVGDSPESFRARIEKDYVDFGEVAKSANMLAK